MSKFDYMLDTFTQAELNELQRQVQYCEISWITCAIIEKGPDDQLHTEDSAAVPALQSNVSVEWAGKPTVPDVHAEDDTHDGHVGEGQ